MAYITGVASTIGDLWTALTSGLTANGWTLAATNIYTKGGIYIQLVEISNRIEVRGGTGESGGALTGAPAANGSYDATMSLAPIGSTGFQYPANYYLHIHTSPDEVYFLVNESSTRWSWCAFGKSNVTTLPGSGNWYAASCPHKVNNVSSVHLELDTTLVTSFSSAAAPALFWNCSPSGTYGNTSQPYNATIAHGLDSIAWSKAGSDVGAEGQLAWTDGPSALCGLPPIYKLLKAQPNTWNQQSVLIRAQGYVHRGSGKFSLVVDPEHCRYIRNDNYNDGDILTIGSDEWKVYPFVKKDLSVRNGGSSVTHSGTIALAVRYDGP